MTFPQMLTAKGKSGTIYQFDVIPKNCWIKPISAVYMFVKQNIVTPVTYSILYIGETFNLQVRIATHEKWPCVNNFGCTHIAYLHVSGEKNRLAIKYDLRKSYITKCNYQ